MARASLAKLQALRNRRRAPPSPTAINVAEGPAPGAALYKESSTDVSSPASEAESGPRLGYGLCDGQEIMLRGQLGLAVQDGWQTYICREGIAFGNR